MDNFWRINEACGLFFGQLTEKFVDRVPSEIPAQLPGQFGHSGQILLHWAAATLKGLNEFQNKNVNVLNSENTTLKLFTNFYLI